MKLSATEEIFHRALDFDPGEDRAAYLRSACKDNAALRIKVEELLAAHEARCGFLDTVPQDPRTIEQPVEESPGVRIGRYKLLEKVGEGGCGVVYVAEQTEPVRRRVALKVIKLGMDTKAVVARFEAERQALAIMDHPNIAKVLDAGTTDAGRPYFVMELVRGIRINEYCDQKNLCTAKRIDLFVKVCQAIQHAHQKGIIHRDIKPSNILITLHDGIPVPKVIDFGIAKATEGRLTNGTVYTQLHQFIGTPAYMSPEQAEMSGLDIDTRSDIYSLGVLLYELLTGATPFDATELMQQGLDEMRRTIREREPARPSTRLATLQGKELTTTAQRRSVDSAKLVSQLQGDLDWIVMKCLDKDRTRRYETANGLAADLNRHLTNEPVAARPPSAIYRLHKAWRRNRLAYSAAAAIGVALLAGAVVSYLQADRARKAESLAKARLLDVQKERDATEEARQNAEQVSQFLQQIFQSPDPARDGRKITVAETLDRALRSLDSDLPNQPERKARLRTTLAKTYMALGLFPQAAEIWKQVHDYWLRARGQKDKETLSAGGFLALALQLAGQLQEALQLSENLLAPTMEVFGRASEQTARLISVKANVLDLRDRLDEARGLREEALALFRQALGPEHRETLNAMNNLGVSYYRLGQKEKSLSYQEELTALCRKALGDEHPTTLMNIANLGVDYNNLGRYAESVKLLEPTLATMLRVFGTNHTITLGGMQHLAAAYEGLGRTKETLELREKLQELTLAVLGPEHPDMVHRSRALAKAYLAVGRSEEALKASELALSVGRKIYGGTNAENMMSLVSLAEVYAATDRLPEAVAVAQRGLEVAREVFGPDDVNTYRVIGTIAALYARQARWTLARDELSRIRTARTTNSELHFAFLRLAALEAHLGRIESYETVREDMIIRYSNVNSAEVANRIAKACLIYPWRGEGLKRAAELAELGVTLTNESTNLLYWRLYASALAAYRSGDWARAVERAERSIVLSKTENSPISTASASFVLAMAQYRLMSTDQARVAFQTGTNLLVADFARLEQAKDLGDSWYEVLIAFVLMKEARELLR